MPGPRPLTIRGVSYPSIMEASRQLGIHPEVIRQTWTRGTLQEVGLKRKSGGGVPIPIRIRGITYPSVCAAARALGVIPSTIHRALDRGTLERVALVRKKR